MVPGMTQLSPKGKVQLIFNIPDISGHKGSKIQGVSLFLPAYFALEIAEFGPAKEGLWLIN